MKFPPPQKKKKKKTKENARLKKMQLYFFEIVEVKNSRFLSSLNYMDKLTNEKATAILISEVGAKRPRGQL